MTAFSIAQGVARGAGIGAGGSGSDGGLGGELIVNGGFSDASGWTLNAAGSIVSGEGVLTESTGGAAALFQAPGISQGLVYRTTYTVVAVTTPGDGVCIAVGGTSGTPRLVPGTYTEDITAGFGTTVALRGFGAGAVTCTVDNVSVRRVSG